MVQDDGTSPQALLLERSASSAATLSCERLFGDGEGVSSSMACGPLSFRARSAFVTFSLLNLMRRACSTRREGRASSGSFTFLGLSILYVKYVKGKSFWFCLRTYIYSRF